MARRSSNIATGRLPKRCPPAARGCRTTMPCSIPWIGSTAPPKQSEKPCNRQVPRGRRSWGSASTLPVARCCPHVGTARRSAWSKTSSNSPWPGRNCGSTTGPRPRRTASTSWPSSRNEDFLKRYGGIIGLEWFFPKIFETLEEAPAVFDAAEVWLEAGDWYVWQLVGGDADALPRSTCQAGYKAMWSKADGYPSESFLRALHPKMANVVKDRMPGRLLAPGEAAGELNAAMAQIRSSAGHPGQRRHHRCPCRRTRGGSCRGGNARHGDGHQQLPHAQLARGSVCARCGGRRAGWHSARFFRLRNRPGGRRRLLRLAASHARTSRLRPTDGACYGLAAGRGWRPVDRLAQRLPHAADERIPDRSVSRLDAQSRSRASVPRTVGGVRVRSPLDCRVVARARRTGQKAAGDRRLAACQSLVGANLRRRAGTAGRRASLQAGPGTGCRHSGRLGGGTQSERIRFRDGRDPCHGRPALGPARPRSADDPTPAKQRESLQRCLPALSRLGGDDRRRSERGIARRFATAHHNVGCDASSPRG